MPNPRSHSFILISNRVQLDALATDVEQHWGQVWTNIYTDTKAIDHFY
jgi:hypothetical protein